MIGFPTITQSSPSGCSRQSKAPFGEQGLERLTEERIRQQVEIYRARMPGPGAPLEERAATLARLRCEEGYMAEWRRQRDGTIELVENHCSIAKAARFYPKLCGGELSLFRAVLGDGVSVERVEHTLGRQVLCLSHERPTPRSDVGANPVVLRAAPEFRPFVP